MEKTENKRIKVGVVGPCGAGKTTLVKNLALMGWEIRHIAQEHSYIQTMWKKITNPDILIFLDASYEVTMERRKFSWTQQEYLEQQRRLNHARDHADLYLMTDGLSPEVIADKVYQFLEKKNANRSE